MSVSLRTFGRTGRLVSELGAGMWGIGGGIGGWTGSDERTSRAVLQAAVDAGVTFFNSALVYGAGTSDRLLGELVRANPGVDLVAATKIPPLNKEFPPAPGTRIRDVFPPAWVKRSVESSLRASGLAAFDLVQFHVWQDEWADDDGWRRSVEDLRASGKAGHVGLSINRWQPDNGVRAVRTGLLDSVQVVYNIFEQRPDDALIPACREAGVAVIARVPFDEGSLTGALSVGSRWPDGDFRNNYFNAPTLAATLPRVDALRPLAPEGSTLADIALRFILSNPDVSTVIPGMRSPGHVAANVAAAAAGPLPADLLATVRQHRWDRPLNRAAKS